MERDDDEAKGADEAGWGVVPPYGAYRGHYGDYELGQRGSQGSGRLGGWSAVALGGSFEENAPGEPAQALEGDDDLLAIDVDLDDVEGP